MTAVLGIIGFLFFGGVLLAFYGTMIYVAITSGKKH
jgi:hypothetical protein